MIFWTQAQELEKHDHLQVNHFHRQVSFWAKNCRINCHPPDWAASNNLATSSWLFLFAISRGLLPVLSMLWWGCKRTRFKQVYVSGFCLEKKFCFFLGFPRKKWNVQRLKSTSLAKKTHKIVPALPLKPLSWGRRTILCVFSNRWNRLILTDEHTHPV